MPSTLLACPPNKNFIEKYHIPSQPELKHRNSTESIQKTDRISEKGESVRALARTNSIEQLNKNLYGQRAASTAALQRGRMLSSRSDLRKPLPSQAPPVQTAPYVWITFF